MRVRYVTRRGRASVIGGGAVCAESTCVHGEGAPLNGRQRGKLIAALRVEIGCQQTDVRVSGELYAPINPSP